MLSDEKKAEKYIKQDGTNGEKVWEKINKEFPNSFVVKTEKSKTRLAELLCEYTRVVFIDGLAEGRKEGYEQGKNNERELQCGKKNYEKDIERLEKENAGLKQILYKLVNAFNDYECAGSEQEQENTWEILRDLMHEELFSIQNGN